MPRRTTTTARTHYDGPEAPRRILLLMAAKTYRAKAFMSAARRLGVDVVVGSDERGPLARRAGGAQLGLDLTRPARVRHAHREGGRGPPV